MSFRRERVSDMDELPSNPQRVYLSNIEVIQITITYLFLQHSLDILVVSLRSLLRLQIRDKIRTACFLNAIDEV